MLCSTNYQVPGIPRVGTGAVGALAPCDLPERDSARRTSVVGKAGRCQRCPDLFSHSAPNRWWNQLAIYWTGSGLPARLEHNAVHVLYLFSSSIRGRWSHCFFSGSTPRHQPLDLKTHKH